jgi:RNA-directed DNA polymerase
MKIITIPKRNGKFRTIYCPSPEEKKRSASWIKLAQASLMVQPQVDVIHGFMPGRSPVTNATAHIGWEYSLSFDLKDFFDSVTQTHIAQFFLSNEVLFSDCFYDGAARQGLPSSPVIANLAAAPMDEQICKLITKGRLGQNFAYTRYADDLTFSFNHHSVGEMLKERIPQIVESFGFTINPAKTHLQCSKAGRRIITGVAVDKTSIHPTREVKRRLRAMRHQLSNGLRTRGRSHLINKVLEAKRRGSSTNFKHLLINGYHGLLEWSRLRIPEDYKPLTKSKVRQVIQSTIHTAKNTLIGLAKAGRKITME